MKKIILSTILLNSFIFANDEISVNFVGLNANYKEDNTFKYKSNFDIKGAELKGEKNIITYSGDTYSIGISYSNLKGNHSGEYNIDNLNVNTKINDLNIYLKDSYYLKNTLIYTKLGMGKKEITSLYSNNLEIIKDIPYISLNFGFDTSIIENFNAGVDLGFNYGYNVQDTLKFNDPSIIDIRTNTKNYIDYSLSIPLKYKLNENTSIVFENKIEFSNGSESEEYIIDSTTKRDGFKISNFYTKIGLNFNF